MKASRLIALARSQVGVKESPKGSNNVKYNTAYYGRPVHGSGYPWCCAFIWWLFQQTDPMLFMDGGKTARCATVEAWAREHGQWVDRTQEPKPGDLVLFGNGKRTCHIGIVASTVCGIHTIEGNTSITSNDNGGAVMERNRTVGKLGSSWHIVGFVRPPYTPEGTPEQEPSPRLYSKGLAYRVHVQGAGWLPVVHDGQVAGTVGQHARVEALRMAPPTGVTIDCDAHIQGIGWKHYKGIERGKVDPVIGTTGQSRRLEAVSLTAKGARIRYRAHVQGIGWQEWVRDGEVAGTTGESRRLEALQIELL
jgi:hypothetical protein